MSQLQRLPAMSDSLRWLALAWLAIAFAALAIVLLYHPVKRPVGQRESCWSVRRLAPVPCVTPRMRA